MDTVYIETTVIGSIAGRMHPNPLIAARQTTSRVWWSDARTKYQLFVSQLVIDECLAGDPDAAQERVDELTAIPRLQITDAARDLADALMDGKAIPESEPRDALHIGIAAVHGIQYLVTWNFKHILNPHLQAQIAGTCRGAGFVPPVICTPEQLKATEDDS